MNLNILNLAKTKFGMKVFLIFTLLVFFISLSFTLFFFFHQKKTHTETMIKNNLMLVSILAYNCRIGVFSENEKLLRDPVDGLFEQKEIVEVSVYNLNGRLLKKARRFDLTPGEEPAASVKSERQIEPRLLDKFSTTTSPFHMEIKDKIEFWAPVIAGEGYSREESLFVKKELFPKTKRIIGWVRITVIKKILNQKLRSLLINSILIGFLFLLVGDAIVYVMVNRVIYPLNRLIKEVKALEKGDLGEKVPVETKDEIGKLAAAFNQMSETLKLREAEKERLQKQLRHAQKMEAIGTLSGGIAHDFNNILGAIIGYTELALLTAPRESEMHHFLDEVFKAGTRAKNLVKQILTFSRMGTTERRPMRIEPIVKEALTMIRATLPTTIEIRKHFKSDLASVLSDPTQIHQVMINICANAGHAMDEKGGILDVSLDELEIDDNEEESSLSLHSGRYQRLTVSDTGHGMAPSVMERIFDPYYTTKGPGKGTGMGLSAVHGIVKGLGGEIVVRSEPGKGSSFEIYFPTVDEKALERREILSPIPRGSERLLFVDDEKSLVDIGLKMLQELGYQVSAKTSSIKALELFRIQSDQFDLIITDMTMPHMTGMQLAENIKQIRPEIPIIILTGFSEAISKEKTEAIGINSVLIKPVTREVIARKIREALAHGGK
ncbi:response regulator [Thermodesulfobacteriota bacterium]